ncbi:MAG TPA: AsnC family transcriptional regulator, partial [Desulfotomaculum sp.]|nr:AsnC family transcriptional regulator [Desulfotomaculum sp.]
KLSTKARYGIRALLDIAQHNLEGPVLLREIAKRQDISRNYLEQILISLKAAGFVRSERGNRGGFILAKNPSEIRLDQAVQVLEGKIALVECVDDPKVCPRTSFCPTHELWGEVTAAMNQVLKSKTLQDLLETQKQKGHPQTAMYYI